MNRRPRPRRSTIILGVAFVAVLALYVRVFSRGPTPKEQQTCLNYIRLAGDRQEAFEDILWSLINSTEFITRR